MGLTTLSTMKRYWLILGAGVTAGFFLSPGQGACEEKKTVGKPTPANETARGNSMSRPKSEGRYYDVLVPDTLDLAERARLGVSHLTSVMNPDYDYEMYWDGIFYPLGHAFSELPRPVMIFQHSPLMACQPKAMEALAMARIMSGSKQNLDRDASALKMLSGNIGDEGIYWVPKYPNRPWLGSEENRPCANVHGQARMVRAMFAWYQYTGNPAWKELIDRMVDGIDKHLVVHKDHYAYFSTHGWMDDEYFRSCYVKGKGWKDTTEPTDEKSGEEGSLFNHQGHTPGVLANWYMMTGNEQALRLSGELVRFLTKPKFWADWKGGDYPNVIGAEHAHWTGHFYGHINTLRAILEYAIATNDVQLKNFVRDGYEWARHEWLMGPIGFGANGQGCGTPRIIGLAVKLSEAGIGDYWEDVDRYIRNHGTEMQFTEEDIPYLRQLEERKATAEESKDPGMTTAGVLEASIGAFSADPYKFHWAMCCSPHGIMGLFYAWDGILRYSDGVARVNLLLNRASPWIDIDSYLPYEGKVVLRNKTAREALVRIPLWVDRKTVGCRTGSRKVPAEWLGNYIRVKNLKQRDIVTIDFRVEEWTEKWTTDETLIPFLPGWPGKVARSYRFRANTLVEITPPIPTWPLDQGPWWLYQNRAKKYAAKKAPMKKVTRFATPLTLQW